MSCDVQLMEGLTDAELQFFKNASWKQIINILSSDADRSNTKLGVADASRTKRDTRSDFSSLQNLDLDVQLGTYDQHVDRLQTFVIRQYYDSEVLTGPTRLFLNARMPLEKRLRKQKVISAI